MKKLRRLRQCLPEFQVRWDKDAPRGLWDAYGGGERFSDVISPFIKLLSIDP